MQTRQSPLDGHVDRDAADLQLYLFGSPRIVHAGRPVAISRQQVRALLYRLAARLEPVSRDHLSFLFWPDVPDVTARRNLTQLLSHLRRALPDPNLLLASTEQVRLNQERIWSDVATFEAVCDTPLATPNVPALHAAVDLYTGRFLDGISFPGETGEYETWLSAEQQHFERLYLDTVRFLLESDTAAGRYDDAILLARTYLTVDELDEDVHRQLIQLYAFVGDRSAALQQHEVCVTVLERELGVNPLPETRAIYQAVLDPLLPDSTDDQVANPYKGLRPFEEEDAQLFFGREHLVQMLVEQLSAGGPFERFLAIVGPSGSGKSSLVRAGLIPALRQGALSGSETWIITSLVPGSDPVAELEAALARVNGAEPAAIGEAIRADQYGLLRILDGLLAKGDSDLVIVIDQFEEVFTLVEDEALRDQLLDNLYTAVATPDSRLRLLITLRADFYDRPLLHAGFSDLMRERTEVVVPLTAEELQRAIVGPGWRAGLILEPGLVAEMVADMEAQPGALPLLQYALTELVERRDGRTLTLAAYRDSGGVLDALARRADQLYLDLDATEQEIARQIFLRLVTLGEGVDDTRRRVLRTVLLSLSDDTDSVERVLDCYGRYRLLTFDRDPVTRTPTVELTHEALIPRWSRLRRWLDESCDALRIHRRLLSAATEWKHAERDASFLARGARLAQFEAFASDGTVALGGVEKGYLDASIADRDRRREEQEAARRLELERERERAEEQARSASRFRRLAAVLAIVFLLALAAAIFARSQQVQAQQQARSAVARQLTAQALAALNAEEAPDVDLSILLSATALQLEDSIEARSALLSGLQYSPHLVTHLHGHTNWINSVAFSPDGTILASGSGDGTVRFWNGTDGEPIAEPLDGHGDWVFSVAFSPDGQTLASGGAATDKSIILWDVASGQPTGKPLADHTGEVWDIDFHPDGRRLVSATTDAAVRLWDTATGQLIGRLTGGHTDELRSVTFSPDGSTLASSDVIGGVMMWDVETNRPIGEPLRGHDTAVWIVRFSPDGKRLATADADGVVIIWDAETLQAVGQPLVGHSGNVRGMAFSPDSKMLATGSDDNNLILWDVATGQMIGGPLKGHSNPVKSVAFSADGKVIASGGWDNNVILWNVLRQSAPTVNQFNGGANNVVFTSDGKQLVSGVEEGKIIVWDIVTGEPLQTLNTSHTAYVSSVALSPDGTLLASGSDDATVRRWNLTSKQPIDPPLIGHTGVLWSVAISPDGKTIASSSADTTVRLWDAQTGKGRRLTEHTDGVTDVAFSPDGQMLASASEDGTVMLWDVATGNTIGEPLTGHPDVALSVAFSPDSTTLASGGGVGADIILWDVATRQQLGEPFSGHSEGIWGLDFSPDGKMLASGSFDNTVMLWDVATRQRIGLPFVGHTENVYRVAFSPDGKALASTGDEEIILWDVDLESWQDRACRIANRTLTQSEWTQFVGPDIPYERVCPDRAFSVPAD